MDIEIVEVSPRDGLQNEKTILSTSAKVDLIEQVIAAGARRIEAVSFAHPRLVPTMADAEAVMAAVPRLPGVSYSGLVLNRRGIDRAIAAGVDEINAVVCVSDTFSRRNQNCSTEESLAMALDVVEVARQNGIFAAVTLATAFGCPFEGEVSRDRVLSLARQLVAGNAQEVCFADTVGVGDPSQVISFAREFAAITDVVPQRFHFHNTRNTGFANAATAVSLGISTLDSSAGGIGGCPFAPKATGNIATEDLIYMLERMGHHTGWDLEALLPTAAFLSDQLGHEISALLPKAGVFPQNSLIQPGLSNQCPINA